MTDKLLSSLAPTRADFEKAYNEGKAQLISRKLSSDLETPVSVYLKLCQNETYSFLMESVQDGEIRGRYSMIGFAPEVSVKVVGGKAYLNQDALTDPMAYAPLPGNPIEELGALLQQNQIEMPEDMPSMAAGWFGYMAYDMVRYMEALPSQNPDILGLPESIFIRPTIVVVFDDATDTMQIVTPIYPRAEMSADSAYDLAEQRLGNIFDQLQSAPPKNDFENMSSLQEPTSNMSRAAYLDMVGKVKKYIVAGDIFQGVVSQRFSTPFSLPPFELYRSLRRVNPSPYLFYLKMDDFSLVGSSPEVLVGLTGKQVNSRQIAGTQKIGKNRAENMAIADDLLADEKERAEHLMLLDLGRNDVGRVSKKGSVEVTEAFSILQASHVIHIISNVIGTLSEDCDFIDALMAGFPAGTVSGAPKIRAMEIIDELEPEKRGVYAGCVGYFSAGGDMDTCITLRTGIVKDNQLYVQAGAGVVYDSVPEMEYEETVNKAMALFRAAEAAIEQNKSD
mgnify:FL=1